MAIGSLFLYMESPCTPDAAPLRPLRSTDAADPRRVRARAAIVNLGQRQETPGLTGITRSPRQTPQSRTIEIIPQQNPRRHGKPPCVCHLESDRSRFGNPPNESRIQGLGITSVATSLAVGNFRELVA